MMSSPEEKTYIYRAYGYFYDVANKEYTSYPDDVKGYIRAKNSWEALDKLHLEGDEFGAERVEYSDLKKDVESIKKEIDHIHNLQKQLEPFIKESKIEQEKIQEEFKEYLKNQKKSKKKKK